MKVISFRIRDKQKEQLEWISEYLKDQYPWKINRSDILNNCIMECYEKLKKEDEEGG